MIGKYLYKMELIAVVFFIGVALVIGFMAVASKEGRAIGLIDGRLAPCTVKPNCVCSEYPDEGKHFIAPFIIPSHIESVESLSALIKELVSEIGGDVQLESYTYISAVFTSTLWGFVDDFEVRIDMDAGEVYFRSASRVGHSDWGVNAKRVNRLIGLLEKRLAL